MAVTFDQIQQFDNGAKFYTADLHIHSYGASADVHDSSMTVEGIIDAAVATNISILSITDHNNDKNVEAAVAYAQKYAKQLLFIPGVEVTTSNGHLLAYFPPQQAKSVSKLLALIRIVGEYGSQESHTPMSMAEVLKVIADLGGLGVAAHIDRAKTGFEAVITGYPNAKSDIIASVGLVGLEFDDPEHLKWYSMDDDKASGEGAQRINLIKKRASSTGTSGRAELAHVQNSDAHDLDSFKKQVHKRFLTRYKLSDLSFDSLRTAFIDSGARVRALAVIPPSFPRILGMFVVGGFIDKETFHFSDNLTSFIGGRGTGKSTGLRALVYGLSANDDLASYDNCPDQVTIFCEDGNGIRYRYVRSRGLKSSAQVDDSGQAVPTDIFRVEYYGQGRLAEVSKDPLNNSIVLQTFLDSHLVLTDLFSKEKQIIELLTQNGAQLAPLESNAAQLPSKNQRLKEFDEKLKAAETGKLKEVAAYQIRLNNEKGLARSLATIRDSYLKGISLASTKRNFGQLLTTAGELTGKKESSPLIEQARKEIESVNEFATAQEADVNSRLKEAASSLTVAITGLEQVHQAIEKLVNEKIGELQKQGLSGNISELTTLVTQRSSLAEEISKIDAQQAELQQIKNRRNELLESLSQVRADITSRRKSQLTEINHNFRDTIQDYVVVLHYDVSGVIDSFRDFILQNMQGTWMQEDLVRKLCKATTPQQLASLVREGQVNNVAGIAGLGETWALQLITRLKPLTVLHQLEAIWKPPQPVIKVVTIGAPVKEIPVNQLSDGQKHTIMLTIAMLAESNVPLIIDQPEDDLDNSFIFTSVVKTLRSIKERRQVILVTHNANISVLGDSELILPMRRNGNSGQTVERGSIDKTETRKMVQDILEGGELAFRRRKEIYGVT